MIPDSALQPLGKSKALRSLVIHSPHLQDKHLKVIANISQLVSLDLSGCPRLTGPGFAVLSKLSQLEELQLNGTRIDSAGLRSLVGLKMLRKLGLQSASVSNDSLEVFAKFPALRELDLGGGNNDAGLAKLKEMKQLRPCCWRTATSAMLGWPN